MRLVDREFDVFHGTGLKAGNDIIILGRDSCKEIPSPVVKIFTNIKFHSRIKYLNLHDINENNMKTVQKRKSARDLLKNVHNQF